MSILTAFDSAHDVGVERKFAPHRSTAAALRKLAAQMGLAKGAYDIRSNKAGDAVAGDVTLHGEAVYVQVGSPCGILVRTCKGRKDYTGGPNHFFAPTDLLTPETFAVKVCEVLDGTSRHRHTQLSALAG